MYPIKSNIKKSAAVARDFLQNGEDGYFEIGTLVDKAIKAGVPISEVRGQLELLRVETSQADA